MPNEKFIYCLCKIKTKFTFYARLKILKTIFSNLKKLACTLYLHKNETHEMSFSYYFSGLFMAVETGLKVFSSCSPGPTAQWNVYLLLGIV